MSKAATLGRASIRERIADLYADYAAAIDDQRFDDWVELFTDDCWYRVVPRENYDAGLPLCTLSLKGKGMLKDRIYGVESTIFHAPYYQRHVIGLPRIVEASPGLFDVEANYSVFRTKRDSMCEIFSVGKYRDRVIAQNDAVLFIEKVCVFDNDIIPNSLIYPI